MAGKKNITATAHNLLTMSSDENFIILILDCIDAGDFSRIINEKESYKETFTDFTYYENVVGGYGYTKHSVPFIISGGEWYENDIDFEKYVIEACTNSPLVSLFREEGWNMGLYDQEIIQQDEKYFLYDNVMYSKKGTTSVGTFAFWEIEMVCYKYMPFDMKRFFIMDPSHFDSLIKPAEGEEIFYFADSNKRFYRDILEKEIKTEDNKQFKFIHLDGAHATWDLDENMQVSDSATYETEIEASIVIMDAYLKKLREENVYNNSVIMIMSDHGYKQGDALHHQHPMLLIKGVSETHDFEISDLPISYEDLGMAYDRLLQGYIGTTVFDVESNRIKKISFL